MMFLTLLFALSISKARRRARGDKGDYRTINLPDNCTRDNTVVLSSADDLAYMLTLTFGGEGEVKPASNSRYTLVDGDGGGDNFRCVVCWGTAFLKYSSDTEILTDLFVVRDKGNNNVFSKPTLPTNSSYDAFLLNFDDDDDDINIARFEYVSGTKNLILYNSPELEMDEDISIVSLDDYYSGTLQSNTTDEAVLLFFPEGEFEFDANSTSKIEAEPVLFDCSSASLKSGICDLVEYKDAEGTRLHITGKNATLLYLEIEQDEDHSKRKAINIDFSYRRITSGSDSGSDSTGPDTTVSASTTPDTTGSNSIGPDTTVSVSTTPDTTGPNSIGPDTTVSASTEPDATVPDPTGSDIAGSDLSGSVSGEAGPTGFTVSTHSSKPVVQSSSGWKTSLTAEFRIGTYDYIQTYSQFEDSQVTPSTSTSSSGSKSNTGAIVGGVIGGVVIVLAICGVGYWFYTMKSAKREGQESP